MVLPKKNLLFILLINSPLNKYRFLVVNWE